jgi:ABC-type multidrug transport system fused ATPase/permease subunit
LAASPPDDTPQFEVTRYTARDVIARFWPLVRPYRWRWALAAVLVCVTGLGVSVMPLFPKYIIDHAIPLKRVDLAMVAAGLFLLAQFARMAGWYVASINVYHVQQSVVFRLRAMGFAHLQRLCLRFHNRYPSGYLYERVFGNSINTLGGFMQQAFQHLVLNLAVLAFSLSFCLYLNRSLTAVIFAGAVGYVLVARRMSRRIYEKTQRSMQAGMRIVEMIMDKLRGHKTIQALAMEDRVQQEFESQLWPYMMKWMDSVLETMKLGFITEGLSYIITAIVTVGGAWAVMHAGSPLGTLVAFVGYQATLIGMIQTLTNFYGTFMASRSAFDQLFTVLDTASTVPEKPGAAMPATPQFRLELDRVTFAYTPGRPVLREVSAVIPAGRTVALVGRSGSGKTTLANLLLRFYDPDSGAIRFDGVDLRDLPLRPYRAHWGVVLQDPYLFDTTIAANMRYAKPDATDDEIRRVLVQARAWDFVQDFADGLQHRVGEAGSQLSGGQRQRLAIARCMLLPSRFVILDEATSALDAESEILVKNSMEALFKGRTVFIIAHRLSTIRSADRVLVMDGGRLVEEGTFDELLACQGVFHHLYRLATTEDSLQHRMDQAGFA